MKWIAVLIMVLMATTVFADNTERIKELTTETAQLQQRLQQYQQITQNIRVRLIQIDAIVIELKDQDSEGIKEEVIE